MIVLLDDIDRYFHKMNPIIASEILLIECNSLKYSLSWSKKGALTILKINGANA